LEAGQDRATFLAFVQILVDEREQANQIKAAYRSAEQWSGALNWQNDSINSCLDRALGVSATMKGAAAFLPNQAGVAPRSFFAAATQQLTLRSFPVLIGS
jgi:hypothetical protein